MRTELQINNFHSFVPKIFQGFSIAAMGAKDALTFRYDFLAGGVAFFIRVWLLVLVYSSVLAGKNDIQNLNYYLTYLFLASAVGEFTHVSLVDEVSQAVMQGTAALDLIRPISWPSRLFWSRLGERLVSLLGETLPGMIVLGLVMKPQLAVTPQNFVLGIISVALGFWISFHVSLFFAILALKLVQAWGIRLLESTFFMLFSGVLFPKELLPPAFVFLTTILPFQLAVQGPVQVFLGNGGNTLLIQGCWAILLPLVVRSLFRRVSTDIIGFGG